MNKRNVILNQSNSCYGNNAWKGGTATQQSFQWLDTVATALLLISSVAQAQTVVQAYPVGFVQTVKSPLSTSHFIEQIGSIQPTAQVQPVEQTQPAEQAQVAKSIPSATHIVKSVNSEQQVQTVPSGSVIPPAYQRISQKHNINASMLLALAKTESGRNGAFGVGVMPWPWTANICDGAPGVRCKGYWFKTRQGLYTQLAREIARGNDWFDVGQVQMNWHYHQARFKGDLWAATHPLVNLNQAAMLISELNQKHPNATDLFAAYHAGSAWRSKAHSERRVKQIMSYANKTARHYQHIIASRGSL